MATAIPTRAERHPRETPAATMIVSASTLSTALARKTATARVTALVVLCMRGLACLARRNAANRAEVDKVGATVAVRSGVAVVGRQDQATVGAEAYSHRTSPFPALIGEDPGEKDGPLGGQSV